MNHNLSSLLVLLTFFTLCHSSQGAPGDLKWTYSAGDSIYSSVAIDANGVAYFGAEDNKFHAVQTSTSGVSAIWQYQGSDWFDSSPAIVNGVAYVGSWDNKMYAIDTANGQSLWSYETGSIIVASPAIGLNGDIYFGSNDSNFYCLNSDGSVDWYYFVGSEIDSSAAIAEDGTIYFGANDGTLYALNPDGSKKWDYTTETVAETDNRIVGSPAVDFDGTIYFGSGNGKLYALNPDGSKKWEYDAVGEVDSSPVIGPEGNIYFGARNGYFHALDSNGIEVWSVELGDIFYSSPVVDSAGNVYICYYVGSGVSAVHVYNDSGELQWDYSINAIIDASPTLTESGILIIGAFDGTLYGLETGASLNTNSPWPKFRGNLASTGNLSTLSSTDNDSTNNENTDGDSAENGDDSTETTSNGAFPGDAYLGDNWYWNEKITYYSNTFHPWLYLNNFGWIFLAEGYSESGFWMWDSKNIGWVYSSIELWPYLYSDTNQRWYYYIEESIDVRWFFDFNNDDWINL